MTCTFSIKRLFLYALIICITVSLPVFSAAARSKLTEGSDFPHFSSEDIGGVMLDTSEYASGKALILDFWSIYCTSCIQEMPYIIDIYKKYKDKGLTALSIDMDAFGVKRVMKFIEGLDFEIPYPTVIDKKRKIGSLLGVSMLPTVILVDPQGKVKLFHVGYKPGFEKELEKIVQEVLPQ